MNMLKLKQLDAHSWKFVHPNGYDDTLDMLDEGCDCYEMGNFVDAEKMFKTVVEKMPAHLDGLHHWALIREESGDTAKAKELWEEAVSIGRKVFPSDFKIGEDLLAWAYLDNRPFLRCMYGLGTTLLKTGDIKRANEIFMEMLKFNPDDNQGARVGAIGSFFYMYEPEEVLAICDSYPYDIMPDTLYGRALAFFHLGKQEMADKALKHAIECLPTVAKEIIKKRHKKPKSLREGSVTVGGDDEAYEYWKRSSIHWESSVSAIEWVKTALQGKKKPEFDKEVAYQLKIKLKGIRPPIWRRLLVKGDITLYKLYIVLLEVMGWSGGHLHGFKIKGKHYGKPDPEFDAFEETINEKKIKLKNVVRREKEGFVFEYDFGDGWEHEVSVEKILPYEQGMRYPVCLKGARACPPEDCGGPYGYANFLDVIQDPKHAEHKSLLERIGGSFDSEEFNLERVNKILKDVEKSKPWYEGFV